MIVFLHMAQLDMVMNSVYDLLNEQNRHVKRIMSILEAVQSGVYVVTACSWYFAYKLYACFNLAAVFTRHYCRIKKGHVPLNWSPEGYASSS